MQSHPRHQLATIGPIDPDEAQLFARPIQALEEKPRPVTFLHRGGGHHDYQKQSQGVHQQMALTPLDLLARIIATNTPNLGSLDALAIQASCRRMFVPSLSLPYPSAQRVVDTLPLPALTPLPIKRPFINFTVSADKAPKIRDFNFAPATNYTQGC